MFRKEDKKLWKIKYGYFKETIGVCFGRYYDDAESDIIEATESEALEWLSQFEGHFNRLDIRLFYKKDGEWILYKKSENNWPMATSI